MSSFLTSSVLRTRRSLVVTRQYITHSMSDCGGVPGLGGGCRGNATALWTIDNGLLNHKLAAAGQGRVHFLDCSFHLPTANRDPEEEFLQSRIAGSRRFNIDTISDHSNPLPHMMPTQEYFQEAVRALGIRNGDQIVCYDQKGSFAAPRAWWMFRAFGYEDVAVLNGGIVGWKAMNGPIESGEPTPVSSEELAAADFTAKFDSRYVASKADVLDGVMSGTVQILDARPADRFWGRVPEPRASLASGHIPGSLNIPTALLAGPFTHPKLSNETQETDGANLMHDSFTIRKLFLETGHIMGAKTIVTCGSGVSACVLALSLHLLGKDLATCPVYDGSWTEWGADHEMPVMTEKDMENP